MNAPLSTGALKQHTKDDFGIIRKGGWIQTFTGKCYWPLDPRERDVCIEDIAHSLSMQVRYNGACLAFYTVAEHSEIVSRMVSPANAFCGLMHDAPEAYIGDMVRPLKHRPEMSPFREWEELNWKVIANKYDLPLVIPEEVELADAMIIGPEKRYVLNPCARSSAALEKYGNIVLPQTIMGFAPGIAKARFLARFHELSNNRWKT